MSITDGLKDKTIDNNLTLEMSAKNSTKISTVVVDATGSIGNSFFLGLKSSSNLLFDTLYGLSLNYGFCGKIRLRQSCYSDFYSKQCNGSYTATSLINLVVHSNRIAFLSGYECDTQNLGTPLNNTTITKGDFKAKTLTGKIIISGSKKVVFKSSNSADKEGSILIDNSSVSISLKSGTIKMSAANALSDNFNPTANLLKLDKDSILTQSCSDVAIEQKKDETSLKVKNSKIEMKNNEINIVSSDFYSQSPAEITLVDVSQTQAGVTYNEVKITT